MLGGIQYKALIEMDAKVAEKRDIHIALDYEANIICFKDNQFHKE